MDVIIIGAGAAGLMAAKQLAEAGLQVLVLEARNRIGGRINSLSEKDNVIVEGGAEFIHGNLETTLALLQEAGLQKQELQGDVWQVIKGKWTKENDFFKQAELVISKLKEINEDITMADFMEMYFSSDEFRGLRESLTGYVEGYYSGETSKTSAKSFLREWESEDDQQYRPKSGYGKMIEYLAARARSSGVTIRLSTVVKEVNWANGEVEVLDESQNLFTASKILLTVPLGIWTAEEQSRGAIAFTPALQDKKDAAKQMGFGAVIKVMLRFQDAFWETEEVKKACGVDTDNFHMVISDMPVPTWWSQLPGHSTLLTGWLSGPKAAHWKHETDETILTSALQSVSHIFHIGLTSLQDKLLWSKVINWTSDPFTGGSYSYSTIHTAWARRVMIKPVVDTLFFAGEALYDGPEMGTVEAALTSGTEVAATIMQAMSV